MQGGGRRRAGGMDDFFGFGDPFAGFPGFANPRSLLMSNFFSRDPFDDPFFSRPGFFGSDVFEDPFFTRPFGSMFGIADGSRANRGSFPSAFIQDAPPQARSSTRGPVIQELSSDGEDESEQQKDDSRNQANATNNGPVVQEPDEDGDEERRASRCVRQRSDYYGGQRTQPQARTYSFQSSTVRYGGTNGAYYTSSMTRKTGGDGVTEEEYKEADTTTGKATHRLSRGIHDKGHSVTKRLNSDGNVNTVQTLHNLNEDELSSFKNDWEGKASQHLPGWNQGFSELEHGNIGTGRQAAGSRSRGWALPSNEPSVDADQRMTGKAHAHDAYTGSQPTSR
ncbi:uncharacterized protein LOC116263366 [Nymphaea colorata]|nr:uncharacterized protein LOC116263366 [Nymphaea colorata]XP_031498940.1 uncharacterized protein LOC116263366 [Nymphaea colorata]